MKDYMECSVQSKEIYVTMAQGGGSEEDGPALMLILDVRT